MDTRCDALFDLEKTRLGEVLRGMQPWEVLGELEEVIAALGETLHAEEYEHVGDGIWISHTARVDRDARIEGPCIIGARSEVRKGAFIRGSALIGDGCVVGNSTEVKNAVFFDGAKAPHFNYVGDSLLGHRVHLGAGAVLSNLRCDGGRVVIRTAPPVTTLRRKVGAMIGDGCEVGCHAVINPGTILGRGCMVFPLTSVRGVHAAGSRIGGWRT